MAARLHKTIADLDAAQERGERIEDWIAYFEIVDAEIAQARAQRGGR